MIGRSVHVHKIEIRVEIGEDYTIDEKCDNNANSHSGKRSIRIVITGTTNIGADGERRTDAAVKILQRVNDSEDAEEIFVD